MPAKYVIHTYRPSNNPDAILNLSMDDKWFRIPPDEPFEIETDSNGRVLETPEFYTAELLAQYGPIYGLVEIPAIRTRTGITLDVDSALAASSAALAQNRQRHINLWAAEQLTTRVSKNLPVLPPTGFVAESIRLLNVDLGATFNLRPVGWDYHPQSSPASSALDQEDIVSLRAQNEELSKRLSRLEETRGRS
jgi:hypothetical protein